MEERYERLPGDARLSFQRLDKGDQRSRAAAHLIERLRTKLLDLTTRNPLLNYRHSDRARAQVRAVDELPDVLYRRLADGESLGFRPVDDPAPEPEDENTDEFHGALEAKRLQDPEYLEGLTGIADDDPNDPAFLRLERALRDRVRIALGLRPRPTRATITVAECARQLGVDPAYDLPRPGSLMNPRHYDDEIQTLLFPDRMEAKLSALREGTRRALEETGINTLFGAYGFLEWYDSPQSEKPFYAPLLLQPLEIERTSRRGRWRYFVKGLDGDTAVNITLAERLKQDHALDLPRFDEDETPEVYWERLQDVVSHYVRWRVRRFVTFGLFSFGRLTMWHDLDPSRWREGESPATNPVVAGLLGGGGTDAAVEAPDYEVDAPEIATSLPPLILDADSSQVSALVDVVRGRSFAIKGPPGTGKSQTIANLIGAAVARGKRVLFLAEKMAALDVVKKRLDECGLGDFVLELHSTRSKKKDVLESFQRRLLQQDRFVAPSEIARERADSATLTSRLNAYTILLNTPLGATGKTIQEILWAAQRISRDDLPPQLDRVVLDNAAALTLTDLATIRNTLRAFEEELAAIHGRWSRPERHPWSWVAKPLSPFEREDLLAATAKWRGCTVDLAKIAGEAATVAPGLDMTLPGVDAFSTILHRLPSLAPPLAGRGLLPALRDAQFRRDVATLHRIHAERRACLSRLAAALAFDAARSRSADLASVADLAASLEVAGRSAGEVPAITRDAATARDEWRAVESAAAQLAAAFSLSADSSSAEFTLLLEAAALIQGTPPGVLSRRRSGLGQDDARARVDKAVRRARELGEVQRTLQIRFDLGQSISGAHLRTAARILRETGLFGRLRAPYRAAHATWKELARVRDKRPARGKARDLEVIADHTEGVAAFARDAALNDLLGPHFDGIGTDFEPLLGAAQFLSSVAQLTAGPSDVETRVRAVLSEGEASSLQRIAGFAQGERYALVCKAIETLKQRGAERLAEVTAQLERELDAANRLASGVQRLGVAPDVTLSGLYDLARDVERVATLEKEMSVLAPTERELRSAGLDPSESEAGITATIAFAEALSAALPSDVHPLNAHLFHPDVDARLTSLQELGTTLDTALGAVIAAREAALAVAGATGEAFGQTTLDDLCRRLDAALADPDALTQWTAFSRLRENVDRHGATAIPQAFGDAMPSSLPDAYSRVFWRSLGRYAFDQHPDLKALSGYTQATARDRFREVDRRVLHLNRQEIQAKLCRVNPPRGNNAGPRGEWTDLALIRHQAQLQRPRIALRDLVRRAGGAAQVLKPCWMMSPISVAQFLEPGAVDFDLVVIDEASQMRPEEAIGALARGRQAVVVGDPMQLPPTSFFDRMDVFDDEAQEDLEEESVLDLALGAFQPFRHLRWHYRSRHENLVRFSNRRFYADKLIVLPSPTDQDGDLGVHYHQVGGTYRGRGGNPDEVKAVAAAALAAMHRYPDWSLGVVTVNLEQAELLRMEIDRLVLRDAGAQDYIARWEGTLEPFFVKNLENVQGDERDSIIISTVYGPNEAGQVMQRFGPINQKTGHRRLNVLFTRAKCRVDLFTSLTAAQVREDEGTASGARALKGYLEYAATGRLEGGLLSRREPDSDFEIAVGDALTRKGYEVTPQVGVNGYFIDLGVKHPEWPHGYLAGIECDGATYHSAQSARDRDILRQKVLEDLGWRLHRVWSTDWFSNPRRELEKLLAFLEDLRRRRSPA